MDTAIICEDGQKRCAWVKAAPGFIQYHDTEWGFPVKDDIRLFEKLCLESFQSGLSWRTIYEKRDNFRAAFAEFDFYKVARFTDADKTRLLNDAGIVRHRGKIDAVINNAARAIEMVEQEGSLATFFWRYEVDLPDDRAARSTSPESIAISKELKKRGWKFVGPTTVYSFLQAMGLVNDHAADCLIRQQCLEARARFVKP